MRDIGKNIRALREKRGMTQEALAEALFVTRQTVSSYETGRSRPDLDMLVKIAQVLEADVNQVLYGLPTDQDRRRMVRRLGVGLLIWAGIYLFCVLTAPIMNDLIQKLYIALPMILSALLSPALWLVPGWCALQTAGLARLVKPLDEQPWVTWLRRVLLVLLGVEVVLFLPLLGTGVVQVIQSVSRQPEVLDFPTIPVYTRIMNELLVFNALHPQVYLIPGGALWLLRFPKP